MYLKCETHRDLFVGREIHDPNGFKYLRVPLNLGRKPSHTWEIADFGGFVHVSITCTA